MSWISDIETLEFSARHIRVTLSDGRCISAPLDRCPPGPMSREDRQRWEQLRWWVWSRLRKPHAAPLQRLVSPRPTLRHWAVRPALLRTPQ